MVDYQLPKQWILGAFRLNAYFLPPGPTPKVETLLHFEPPHQITRQALTNGPDPARPAEEKVDLWNPAWQQQELNKAASGTIPGSNPFKSCPGSLRKG